MHNYIVGDWVVKGSIPTLCNILYGIFGPSLVPFHHHFVTTPVHSGSLPAPPGAPWEQMAAPGVADFLLVLSALLVSRSTGSIRGFS